jgi:hypothetical protein
MTVAAQTFLELQDAALHDDFDPTKYRARAKTAINEALGRIGRRIYSLQRRSTTTVAVSAGTASYALPADLLRVVSLRDAAKHPGELEEADPRWIDDQSASSGTPMAFAVDGSQLTLWPTPTTAVTLTLRYWGTPATLSADGDIPAIPGDYADLLVTYARAKLFLLEDDKQMHDAMIIDFNAGVIEARADLQLTSLRRPRQIPSMWQRTASPRFAKP